MSSLDQLTTLGRGNIATADTEAESSLALRDRIQQQFKAKQADAEELKKSILEPLSTELIRKPVDDLTSKGLTKIGTGVRKLLRRGVDTIVPKTGPPGEPLTQGPTVQLTAPSVGDEDLGPTPAPAPPLASGTEVSGSAGSPEESLGETEFTDARQATGSELKSKLASLGGDEEATGALKETEGALKKGTGLLRDAGIVEADGGGPEDIASDIVAVGLAIGSIFMADKHAEAPPPIPAISASAQIGI